jgi:hypothetical protein
VPFRIDEGSVLNYFNGNGHETYLIKNKENSNTIGIILKPDTL